MSNTEYNFRVECDKHFWSFHTIEEAERAKKEFQRYVKGDLNIVPIENQQEHQQSSEETSLKH